MLVSILISVKKCDLVLYLDSVTRGVPKKSQSCRGIVRGRQVASSLFACKPSSPVRRGKVIELSVNTRQITLGLRRTDAGDRAAQTTRRPTMDKSVQSLNAGTLTARLVYEWG